jgi:hypothetical protein
MRERPEEVVRTTPDGLVERVVIEPPVAPVVERVVERVVEPSAAPVVERVVERVVEPPVAPVVERVVERVVEPVIAPAVVQTDVVSTEYYTAPGFGYDPALARFLRVMWFALGLLEGLLALRFVLALMGANPNNPFASMVYALTGLFVAPFRTLFATPAAGGSVVELYTLIAMVVYFLAWWTVVKLIGVVTNRPVDV